MDGLWTEVCGQQKQSNDPPNNQHNPRCANFWAPLTRKRQTMPRPAQPQHTNHWAPRTRKRHQQEHRPQRPTESSDPTQHAKGRTGDRPGPRKGATTRRNVTRGGFPPPPLDADFTVGKNEMDKRKYAFLGHKLLGSGPPPLLSSNASLTQTLPRWPFKTPHSTRDSAPCAPAPSPDTLLPRLRCQPKPENAPNGGAGSMFRAPHLRCIVPCCGCLSGPVRPMGPAVIGP